MIGYVLGCIRFRSPIVITPPGPRARLRLWLDRRARCHQCGRRMNGLDAGLELRGRPGCSNRRDGRIFFCCACAAEILPGASPFVRFDHLPANTSGGGGAP